VSAVVAGARSAIVVWWIWANLVDMYVCMYVCMYVSMFGYPEAFQTLEVKLGCLGAQLLHGTRWAAAMAGVVW
jgi:hypothetical protein